MNLSILKLAAANRDLTTKIGAKAVLKAAGMKQTLVNDLLGQVALLAEKRSYKRSALLHRERAHAKSSMSTPNRRVLLPKGTVAQRLDDLRKSTITSTLQQSVRIGTHDHLRVELTTDPKAVGIYQVENLDWNNGYKGRPLMYRDTRVVVPFDWRVRVQRRGLATCDGMFTLDAAAVEAKGCELFAATWIVQGRGNAAQHVNGFIAKHGDLTYHASTIDQALSGIARKSRALALTAYLASADLDEVIGKVRGTIVKVSDAKAIGACDYGIRSWCSNVGIDYESGAAPIETVYRAYQREPRPEARAAILYALRRARKLLSA